MASLMTCRVHPVVVFSIIDAYERRPESGTNKVIGTLLGTYEKGVIEVTNCYNVPHSEANEEAQLQTAFNKEMFDLYRKSNPNELPVGWFSTSPEVNELSMIYHQYYHKFVNSIVQSKEQMSTVLLTVDTTLKDHRMGLKAYVRVHAGIPGTDREQCTIFMPLEIEIVSFETEQIGLDIMYAGTMNAKRRVDLFSSVEQISSVISELLENIKEFRKFTDEILAGKRPADPTIGRKLMEVVSSVSQIQPKQFENMLISSMKDYLMIVYLAQLSKTQLSLHKKLIQR